MNKPQNIKTTLNIQTQIEQGPQDFQQLNFNQKQHQKYMQELDQLISIHHKQVSTPFRIHNQQNTDFTNKQNHILDKLDQLETSCLNRLNNDMIDKFDQFTIHDQQQNKDHDQQEQQQKQYILYDLSDIKYDQKTAMIENMKYIKPQKMEIDQIGKDGGAKKRKRKREKEKEREKNMKQNPLLRNGYFDM